MSEVIRRRGGVSCTVYNKNNAYYTWRVEWGEKHLECGGYTTFASCKQDAIEAYQAVRKEIAE